MPGLRFSHQDRLGMAFLPTFIGLRDADRFGGLAAFCATHIPYLIVILIYSSGASVAVIERIFRYGVQRFLRMPGLRFSHQDRLGMAFLPTFIALRDADRFGGLAAFCATHIPYLIVILIQSSGVSVA